MACPRPGVGWWPLVLALGRGGRPGRIASPLRILTAKKHARHKSIAVLKNTMQNEAYMTPIQYIREKGSTSSDFLSRIGSNTCKNKGDLDV
jgi:hypothetical protein